MQDFYGEDISIGDTLAFIYDGDLELLRVREIADGGVKCIGIESQNSVSIPAESIEEYILICKRPKFSKEPPVKR
jgi:hypothetical protein